MFARRLHHVLHNEVAVERLHSSQEDCQRSRLQSLAKPDFGCNGAAVWVCLWVEVIREFRVQTRRFVRSKRAAALRYLEVMETQSHC